MLLGERLLRVYYAVQVSLHEIHGKVEICVFCRGRRWLEDGQDVDDVFVFSKVLQELQLSQGTLGDVLDLKSMADFLNGHLLKVNKENKNPTQLVEIERVD